jgi:hypothetical protein
MAEPFNFSNQTPEDIYQKIIQTDGINVYVNGDSYFNKNLTATGNITAPSFTGSFLGTASYTLNVTSASYAATASLAPNYVLNSATSSFVLNSQTSSFVTNSQTSSFVRNSQTSSMTVATASWATSSFTSSYVNTLNQNVIVTPPSTPGSGVGLTVSGSNTKGGTGYLDFLQVTNTSSSIATPNKYFRLDTAGNLQVLRSDYNLNILQLSDAGNLYVYGATPAVTSNSDGISGSLMFNNNNSQIYDDGNMHIHSRTSGQSMWINTNGGPLNLLNQAPLAGGATGSGVNIGSGSLIGYVTINNGKSYTTQANYGYLTTSGAGTYPGGSQTLNISLYATQRIWGQEIDAFSDERMKDIQGEIPLEEGLKLVKTLKPIKYTWKDNSDKGLKSGYSAQQVSKAGFDHLISLIPKEGLEETIDDDGFLSPKDTQFSMNYDQVTPYHGVVIKYLLEKIEHLEQEIKTLKK